MADVIDDAYHQTELLLNLSLQSVPKVNLVAAGACHYCGEDVAKGKLFCPGPECRDDYDKEQKLRRISGK